MRRATMAALAMAAATALPAGAQTGEPPYPHGAYREDCTLCHTGDAWRPAVIGKAFKHPSSYPLRGAHATAACRDCHLSLEFAKAATACADCHRDPHRGELGADCGTCHTPRNFLDRSAQLDQHRKTRFPLTGAHVAQDCEACHKPEPQGHLIYVDTPIDCQSCHLPLYLAAKDPDHVAANFPTDCSMCHPITVWTSARFDHRNTAFPLTGAHVGLDCRACHASGYAGTPTACYACHKSDYDNTTDPNHAGAGFPTDCTLCHTTTSFQGAKYTQHDALYFPIYSGHHANRWSTCADCHTVPTNYATFSCFLCHSQSDTDSHHQGVAGYSYDSNACYQCHPRGSAG